MTLSWTKTGEEIVGRDYVVREIRKRLGSDYFFKQLNPDRRAEVLEKVTGDAFLRWHNGETVGSIVRAAKSKALDSYLFQFTRTEG